MAYNATTKTYTDALTVLGTLNMNGELSGKVTSSQYVGGKYIIGVEVNNENWTLSSDKDYGVGEMVNLAYDGTKMVTFGESQAQ